MVEEGRVVVLLHELLRWLVDIHCCHLLLGLAGLLRCSISLLLLLLGSSCVGLDALELIEDVLVVEERVGELVHEGCTSQEPVNTALNHGNLEKLMDCGPVRGVSLEHHGDDVVYGWGIVRGKWCVGSRDNFLRQLMQRSCVEWWGQSSHLVQEDTQGPDVRLEAVAFRFDNLGGKIVRSSYDGLSLRASV